MVALPTPLERLAASAETVAVTGATGWFGRVTLDLLGRALGPEAFRERVAGYASSEREVRVEGVGPVALRPLAELRPAEIVLHYAFVTRTLVARDELDAFVRANVEITTRVLAAVRSGDVRRLLVTSSGAARDPDLARNPYGALKALDELAFAEACRRAGAACAVARVFNVAGPHMSQAAGYALGDLIGRARDGRALEIAARGDVVRAFVAVEAVVLVALGELLDGRDAAFETGGEPVEIEALARTVRAVLGREELPIVRGRSPDAPASVYVGDGTRMAELAARHGVALADLGTLVAATAAGLAQPG